MMTSTETPNAPSVLPLAQAARLTAEKILNPAQLPQFDNLSTDTPVLVLLAAGKGTRFGQDPKCIQPVQGTPLARHSIDAFRRFSPGPVICLVGYCAAEVSTALGADNLYILSDNPTGGTAYATYEAFCTPGLLTQNPLLIVTMGDRIVPPAIYRLLWETHCREAQEADLTFLTAHYEPPKNHGKGRILRKEQGQVLRVIEEKDIAAETDTAVRQALLNLTEGNCPLYAIRANKLYRILQKLTSANAQQQYYITDIIAAISQAGGEIRTITTATGDDEYDLLTSDVTRPLDLALLEGILASSRGLLFPEEQEVEAAAQLILADRPAVQVAAIARQLNELATTVAQKELGFQPEQPVALGISGGRLRIAFMHPDMGRFFGPAWQIPIGAGDPTGDEQIVLLAQQADDQRLHLYPLNPDYRERLNFLPADNAAMYPDEGISDLHKYEAFGTRMSEQLLLALGYFSNEELERRRQQALPLPPPSLWVSNNMRRPFALVGNALASLRTLHSGTLGAKVQAHLGRANFQGLRVVSTGNIPQGGFSSSSAVTVATKNALNALYDLELPPDLLVHLACQAEYGTGVRAGSLDQATEQKGRAGQGTLLSSNPQDNYHILGAYPAPTDRIQILFPYSVERDREAWRWSWGAYAEAVVSDGPLTAGEMRSMTGKAAEIAALLTHLPLNTSFFKQIEADLLEDGLLDEANHRWVWSLLQQLPLRIRQADLRQQVHDQRGWYIDQLLEHEQLDLAAASQKADATLAALFNGWREPLLRRPTSKGDAGEEVGVPLRAMVAYLFGEVAKNFYLIHHPEQWIDYVTLSQRGDRSVEIDPVRLPDRAALETELAWERDCTGPERLQRWLMHVGATPFDYQQGLEDETLTALEPPALHRLAGSNFFRGLALIDLAEAILKRAFGQDAVAVRINAAGQGGYFQVHVDTAKASPAEVKAFIRAAFYRRFGLTPTPEFVEPHPGGGAVGIRLSRYAILPQLIRRLQQGA
ncbi:MAG: NTP transferase domain-containing protein [Caldilineaceae bacterium]